MDSTLKRIFEIEEKAQDIVEDAKKAKASYKSDIEEAAQLIKEDIDEKTDKKILFVKSVEEQHREKNTAEIKLTLEENMKRINEEYREKKDSWIDRTYESIVNNNFKEGDINA